MESLLIITFFYIFVFFLTLRLIKKKDKYVYYSLLFISLFWSFPALLSLAVPFDYFGVKNESYFTVFISLLLFSLILFSGVCSFFTKRSNKVFLKKESCKNTRWLLLYLIIAYIACIFEFFKKVVRGFSFSSIDDLSSNRALSIQPNETDIFSILSGATCGYIYYVLFLSLDRDKNNIFIIRYKYLLPFVIYSLLIFLSGNKLSILIGILVLFFRSIHLFRTQIPKLILAMCLSLFVFIQISTFQNQARIESFSDTSDFKDGISIRIDNTHFAANFVRNLPDEPYLMLATLYGAYGVEYDMLYVSVSNVNTGVVALGSSTLQIIRRVIMEVFLRQKTDSTFSSITTFFGIVSQKYGVFPRVWGTAFLPFFLEGGFPYVLLFVILMSVSHFYLTNRYLHNKQSIFHSLNLNIFYLILTLSLMLSPFNLAVLSLIFASLTRPFVSSLLQQKSLRSKFRM